MVKAGDALRETVTRFDRSVLNGKAGGAEHEGFLWSRRVCGPMGGRHGGGSAWAVAGQRSESQWSLELYKRRGGWIPIVGPVLVRTRGPSLVITLG
jgi:hypothetical protein